MQTDQAKELFRKLKIQTVLDLALLVPVRYRDTTLSSALEAGQTVTVEAVVETAGSQGGKLRAQCRLPEFDQTVSVIFFRATPYHYERFQVGRHLYLQGRLERFRGALQMPQPRILASVGTIEPHYKVAIQQTRMRTLVRTYVTEDSLRDEGLEADEVTTLMRIHFPHRIDALHRDGAFRPEVVRVLKRVEAYNHVRKLRAKRHTYPAMEALTGSVEPFIEGLPFDLTSEQRSVIEAIRVDLGRSDRAARRMIVGDVGSGKTMVMFAAAMMARPHPVLLMAPTSLLALQLYEEAQKYLTTWLTLALVVQGDARGTYRQADLIIGTHALLYLEDLPPAPLVMVDEQHRFGTRQRQELEKRVAQGERRPHYLQFSATPIPRTQAMMESALIDVSLIVSTPFPKRITTHVIDRSGFGELMEQIRATVARNEQVLIVYPLVDESEEVPYQSLEEARGYWEERFERVYVTHGRDKEKEAILLAFREDGEILLATTVVEVGISLPRLTTIVIVGAERLGLATLHQLRGRVGRHGQRSRCYLFTHVPQNERLQAFARTLDGFEIARLDLRYRDSGDILDGTIQSGQKFRWLDLGEDEALVQQATKRAKRYASDTRN